MIRILPSGLYSPQQNQGVTSVQQCLCAVNGYTSGLQTHSRAQNLQDALPGSFLRLMGVSVPICFQNKLPKLTQHCPHILSILTPDTASAIHLRACKVMCISLNICHSLPVSLTNSSCSPLSLFPSFTLFILSSSCKNVYAKHLTHFSLIKNIPKASLF